MAILKLSSANPDFSHVIQKNPNTQIEQAAPFTKNLVDGRTYLMFEDPTKADTVTLLYKHFEQKKSNGFSYLDFTPYSSGKIYLQMINLQLRTAFAKGHELDTYPAELHFNIYNRHERDFTLSFPGKVVSCDTKDYHSLITIQGSSVQETLQICACISLFAFLHDPEVFVEFPQFLGHLTNLINLTNHYPLLRNYVSFIKGDNQFKEALPLLDQTPFDFTLRRSFDSRRDFYLECVAKLGSAKAENILDLGCGEGNYFKAHVKNYENIDAVEVDEPTHLSATHMARKVQAADIVKLHNMSILDYLDPITSLEKTDVLFTEVLEHMEYAESVRNLTKLISLNPNSVIITVPNKAFNQFYDLKDDEFRHDDHKWEPTLKDFEEFLDLIPGLKSQYTVEVSFLGDKLKSDATVSSSIGVLLTRKLDA